LGRFARLARPIVTSAVAAGAKGYAALMSLIIVVDTSALARSERELGKR
jgi:hypothetical protein